MSVAVALDARPRQAVYCRSGSASDLLHGAVAWRLRGLQNPLKLAIASGAPASQTPAPDRQSTRPGRTPGEVRTRVRSESRGYPAGRARLFAPEKRLLENADNQTRR